MRIFKLILISIIMLCIAVLFVFSLFPSHIRISRIIGIHASKEKIYDALNNFDDWQKWNEFISQNNAPKKISTPSGGKGAFIESGGMRIVIEESTGDSIKTSWLQKDKQQFDGGFNIVSMADNDFTVEWYFNFYFKWYPWEKLGSMFYDKQLGPIMEKSLSNLKKYSENP